MLGLIQLSVRWDLMILSQSPGAVKSCPFTYNIFFRSLFRWGILFSHPRDFTPVCTTELARAAKLHDEFKKRDVKMIALSIDSVEDHRKWSEVCRYYTLTSYKRNIELLTHLFVNRISFQYINTIKCVIFKNNIWSHICCRNYIL